MAKKIKKQPILFKRYPCARQTFHFIKTRIDVANLNKKLRNNSLVGIINNINNYDHDFFKLLIFF